MLVSNKTWIAIAIAFAVLTLVYNKFEKFRKLLGAAG